MTTRFCALLVFLSCLAAAGPALAAEQVGKVASAKTAVTSGGKPVDRGDPIFFMDQLATNSTGVGEFLFQDGTRLAIGPSASLVVDRFVVKDKSSFEKLGVKATKGAFRWISGNSPSAAYSIKTPMGTMGVRGTAFDVRIVNGVTHVALLNGKATFCASKFCETLDRRGDYISIEDGKISPKTKVGRVFRTRKDLAMVFPFLANPGMLSQRYRVAGSNMFSAGGSGLGGSFGRPSSGDGGGRSDVGGGLDGGGVSPDDFIDGEGDDNGPR